MNDSSVIDELGLEPHPEGGWHRRTWQSPDVVKLPDGRVRPTATMIHFFLAAGESSAWHRVTSEEIWLAHTGVVDLEFGGADDEPVAGRVRKVGVGPGCETQVVVRAGIWQRTRPTDADALVTCVVSPGFDFEDFQLVSEA